MQHSSSSPIMFMPLTQSTTFLIFIIIIAYSIPTARSQSQGIRLPSEGVCEGAERGGYSCPVKCFRTDPVCGVDGMTYWCGCRDAWCAGTEVSKKGFCEDGNYNASAAAQALLLLHIVWLIILGFSVLFGLF